MNIRQLFGALLRPKARRGTARRGPPQRVLGPVEPLEDRSLMAAGMWSIPIDSPTAVDVNAITGLVSVVGSNTNPTTQQSTGRLVTRSQTGNMTNVDLGHSSVASPSETPIAIRGNAIVGIGRGTGLFNSDATALGWNVNSPGTATNLGFVSNPQGVTWSFALGVNSSGDWIGTTGGAAAIMGNVNQQTAPHSIAIGNGGGYTGISLSDNRTALVTAAFVDRIQSWVVLSDGSTVTLANPLATAGLDAMFPVKISENGEYALTRSLYFDPVSETEVEVPVLYYGANFSQHQVITVNGQPSARRALDVENSGLVTLSNGVDLEFWSPGDQNPTVINSLASFIGADNHLSIGDFYGNPTSQQGGATFVVAKSATGGVLIQIGDFTGTTPPEPVVKTITGTNRRDTFVVDIGTLGQVDKLVIDGRGGGDTFRVTGRTNPSHPIVIEILGGNGNDNVYFATTGPVTANVNLGAGNDYFFGRLSTAVFNVKGGDGSDFIWGSDTTPGTYDGGAGHDTIVALSGRSTITGGSGRDLVITGGSQNTIYADALDIVFATLDDQILGNGRPWWLQRRRRWL